MSYVIVASAFIFYTCILNDRWTNASGHTTEYIYYQQKQTWNEARSVCLSDGGDLAKIDSQEVMDTLSRLSQESYPDEDLLTNNVWVGLFDRSPNRREWASDCSELNFTSNYVEPYKDTELCFKINGNDLLGDRKPCDQDNNFLCERQKVGSCIFNNVFRELEIYHEYVRTPYQVCEDDCANDTMCTGVLYVSPSTCYTFGNDSLVQTNQSATFSTKHCSQFIKKRTEVPPVENKNRSPEVICSALPSTQPISETYGLNLEYSTSQTSTTISTSTISPSLTPTPVCSTQVLTSVSTVSAPCPSTSTTVLPSPCPTLTAACSTQVLTSVSTVSAICPSTSTAILPSPCPTLTQVCSTQVLTLVSTMSAPCSSASTTIQISPSPTFTPDCSTRVSTVSVPCTSTPIPTSSCPTVPTWTNLTVNMTTEEIQEVYQIAEEISKNLTVDVKTTSSHVRSLVSVSDPRTTSTAVGFVGVALIIVPLALIVVSDLRRFYVDIRGG